MDNQKEQSKKIFIKNKQAKDVSKVKERRNAPARKTKVKSATPSVERQPLVDGMYTATVQTVNKKKHVTRLQNQINQSKEQAETTKQMVAAKGCRVNSKGDIIVERGMGKGHHKHKPRHGEPANEFQALVQKQQRLEIGWMNKIRHGCLKVCPEMFHRMQHYATPGQMVMSYKSHEYYQMAHGLIYERLPTYLKVDNRAPTYRWSDELEFEPSEVELRTDSWDIQKVLDVANECYKKYERLQQYPPGDWYCYVMLCFNCLLTWYTGRREVKKYLEFISLPEELWLLVEQMLPQDIWLPPEYKEIGCAWITRRYLPLKLTVGGDTVELWEKCQINYQDMKIAPRTWELHEYKRMKMKRVLPSTIRGVWLNALSMPNTFSNLLVTTSPNDTCLYDLLKWFQLLFVGPGLLAPRGLDKIASIKVSCMTVSATGMLVFNAAEINAVQNELQQVFDNKGYTECPLLKLFHWDPGDQNQASLGTDGPPWPSVTVQA